MPLKKIKLLVFLAISLSLLVGCTAKQTSFSKNNSSQEIADTLAKNLIMTYEVVTNHGAADGLPCQSLHAEWAACNQINLSLHNNGPTIRSKDWKIYFHSIRMILDVQNEQFKVTHITGDLHTLEATELFTGFTENKTIIIPYTGEYWTLFEGDFMPRAYIISGHSQPRIIQSLDKENASAYVTAISANNWKRTPEDNNILASAQSRFKKNAALKLLDIQTLRTKIIPTPLSTKHTGVNVSLAEGISFSNTAVSDKQLDIIKNKLSQLGINTQGSYPITIKINPKVFSRKNKKADAYRLDIQHQATIITGYDQNGAHYGLQSLLTLINSDLKQLPEVKIIDAPRFAYRGLMIDVARHFHSKAVILKTLEQMAAYKLNKLHLHLTDDEGWRLEIPGLPELTHIGARRCHDLSETDCLLPQLGSGPTSDNFGSGYYSRQDYIDILKYAADRGIEVIPEIDMPAHARAAVISMEARYQRLTKAGEPQSAEQYRLIDPLDTSNITTVQFYNKQSFINPCMASSLAFVEKVISEVSDMHKIAGTPLNTWHFGGDEAKNIKLGSGFQDINSTKKEAWKGDLDSTKQDKPFAKSPQCQQAIAAGISADYDHLPSYFAEQVSKLAAQHNIHNFQAWQDGLKYSANSKAFATKNVRVNFWDVLYWGGGASAFEWPEKGYELIVSNPDYVYLDMPYEVDPKERGYYWATRATDTQKIFSFAPQNLPQNAETSVDRDGNAFNSKGIVKNHSFYGLSAQLWSESVRTDEAFEYMVFPRILAVAERAWHRADWEKDYQPGVEYSADTNRINKNNLQSEWNTFANLIGQRELLKLDKASIHYRVPLPGARIVNSFLQMNVSFPGLNMQYSDSAEQNVQSGQKIIWQNYTHKALVSAKNIAIRSVSADGKRFSRIIYITQ